jgi:glycosyltransferase involved in cell wall biosynthesis
MRICLIGPTYPYRGGIAHHTTLLAQHLRAAHEVLLLSFSRQYPAWLFPGRTDRDPSTRPLQTDAHFSLDPLNPRTWFQTMRTLRQWQPDLVLIPFWHFYFTPVWWFLARRIARMTDRPKLVFIAHNVRPHDQGAFGHRLLPFLLRTLFGPADAILVHSSADAAILREILPRAEIITTLLPTFAALGVQRAAQLPVKLPDDRPLLLFCGLIRPYKGLDLLLDALALVQLPVHLLIAGEFWPGGREPCDKQVRELGLTEQVTIIDEYLPDELLAACIDQADVVVLPYRSATQSAVVQIAFGRGTPVITTNVGGLPEAVQHGATGLVVPRENPTALAEAIARYFAEGLAEPFAAQIRANQERFSWAQYIRKIETVWRG